MSNFSTANDLDSIVDNATAGFGPRIYPQFGRYVWEIAKLKTNDGDKGLSFIVEAKILQAERTREDTVPNTVGETVSYVEGHLEEQRKTGRGPAAAGRVQAFLTALLGKHVQGAISLVTADNQPCTLFRIGVLVVPKTLKPDPARGLLGKTINAYQWTHVPKEDQLPPKELKARRAALGLGPL